MRPEIQRFLQRHATGEREAVLADVAPYVGKSLDEIGRDIDAVCQAAAEILAAGPHRERILAHRDPPHPSYRGIIERLRKRYREEA